MIWKQSGAARRFARSFSDGKIVPRTKRGETNKKKKKNEKERKIPGVVWVQSARYEVSREERIGVNVASRLSWGFQKKKENNKTFSFRRSRWQSASRRDFCEVKFASFRAKAR